MDRPHYQKLYSNRRTDERREAPVTEETAKPNKCCGTPCWALLGLLGLIGVILGMLFGLGVIGGLPRLGFDLPSLSREPDVVVDGAGYYNNSITVETQVLEKN